MHALSSNHHCPCSGCRYLTVELEPLTALKVHPLQQSHTHKFNLVTRFKTYQASYHLQHKVRNPLYASRFPVLWPLPNSTTSLQHPLPQTPAIPSHWPFHIQIPCDFLSTFPCSFPSVWKDLPDLDPPPKDLGILLALKGTT